MDLFSNVSIYAYDYEPSTSPRWTDIIQWLTGDVASIDAVLLETKGRVHRNMGVKHIMSPPQQQAIKGSIHQVFNRLVQLASRLPPDSRLQNPDRSGLHPLAGANFFRLSDGANAYKTAVGFYDRLSIVLPERIAKAKAPPRTAVAWKADLAVREEALANFKRQQQQSSKNKAGPIKTTMSTIVKLEQWIAQARSTTASENPNKPWKWEENRGPDQTHFFMGDRA